jgi:chromosome segregation protein
LEEKTRNAKERLEALEDGRKKGDLNISGISQEIKDYQVLNKKLAAQVAGIEKEISKAKALVEEKYASLSPEDDSTRDKRDQLLDARTRLEEEQNKFLDAEKKKSLLQERLLSREKAYEDLQGEIRTLKQELEVSLTNKKQATAQKKSIETELDEDYHKKRDLIDERVEIKTNLDRVGVLLDHKVEELAHLEAKYGAMEEATKRRTSSKAVEAVLKLRDQGTLKGVHGTISELGKVSPTYAKALEIAAGKGLSFLVVEDEGVAEKCITHLKQGHIGRATFLPLKKLKPVPPSREASRIAKSAKGFALDLIRFDEKFKKAFATVFRNTVVVNDIAFAKRVISKARMVTLDGDIIETSGIMSGGHYRSAQEGFKDLDKSRQRLHALRAEVAGLKEERTRLMNEDTRIQEELQELNAQELENTKEREALAERLRTLDGNIAVLRESVAEREVLLKEANSELKELKRDAASMQKASSALSSIIHKIQAEKEDLENELSMTQAEELMAEMKSLEAEVSGLQEERNGLRNQIRINESRVEELLTPRIKELQKHLSALAEEASSLETDLASLMEKKSEVEAQLSTMEDRKRKVSTGIESLKAKREGQIKAVEKIGDKIRDLRQRIEDLARGMERCRIEKAKLETKLEEVQKDLEAFADIAVDLTEPIATGDLEKEIAKMEAELESLEPINMRAIEDYEVVKEKFDKLNSRVDVLQAEREAILKLMDEIEHRKEVVFMEVFEGVAANFRGIFERLSPGGSADLILDEDNPLDGGLQIQARPAGKNPQYIELMSGGEKTLTALSFIFAIQRFQPAPFYILDEIDMFLDDDNVRKVSELIRESSAGDQFIVVSLRSSLMASADQLFGISNEDGVSKIIGVELEEIAA